MSWNQGLGFLARVPMLWVHKAPELRKFRASSSDSPGPSSSGVQGFQAVRVQEVFSKCANLRLLAYLEDVRVVLKTLYSTLCAYLGYIDDVRLVLIQCGDVSAIPYIEYCYYYYYYYYY